MPITRTRGITGILVLLFAPFFSLTSFAQTITLSPLTASLRPGQTRQFSAAKTGLPGTATLTWRVNGINGGDSIVGTISTSGLYTAPASGPADPPTVQVTAVYQTTSGAATVTLLYPVPTFTRLTPTDVSLTALRRTGNILTLTVGGSGFRPATTVTVGGVAFRVSNATATQLTASGTPNRANLGMVQVVVANPDPTNAAMAPVAAITVHTYEGTPLVPTDEAHRFLNRASWGATAATVDRVQTVGKARFLSDQLAAVPSNFTGIATDVGMYPMQRRFFSNAVAGQDQLRQRVAFALSQILVISDTADIGGLATMRPYYELLSANAFGNFKQLLRDMTLNPGMGRFLNMANNRAAYISGGTTIYPNENYAREFLQLFSLGVNQVDEQGVVQLDSNGDPRPIYTQSDILELARVFTGWTWAPPDGQAIGWFKPFRPDLPMVAYAPYHDLGAKSLLGSSITAGKTPSDDLDAAIDIVYNNVNLPPYISRLLIQHLGTSNPSPAYIGRVTAVFKNNGSGVRGDLSAVVKAILTDSEVVAANSDRGQLRAPIQLATGILRQLPGSVSDQNDLQNSTSSMSQNPFYAGSVFSYFSPDYRLNGTAISAPEFQLLTPYNATVRLNFISGLVLNNAPTRFTYSVAEWTQWATNPNAMVAVISDRFYGGKLPLSVENRIRQAITATTTSPKDKAQAALYVALTAAAYQVIQ